MSTQTENIQPTELPDRYNKTGDSPGVGGQDPQTREIASDPSTPDDKSRILQNEAPTSPDAASILAQQKKLEEEAAIKEFSILHKAVRRDSAKFVDVGVALLELRQKKLWKYGHYKTWGEYCLSACGKTPQHVLRLIAAANIAKELLDLKVAGILPGALDPLSESQVRHLARLDTPDEREKLWIELYRKNMCVPSERMVKKAVDEILGVRDDKESAKNEKMRELTLLLQKLREGLRAVTDESVRLGLEDSVGKLETVLKLPQNASADPVVPSGPN